MCTTVNKKHLKQDAIGGMLLVVGALFYCLNVYETFIAHGTEGVNVLWATFFVVINFYYIRIFYIKKLWYSAVGSSILALTESVWLGQIIYYLL